MKPNSSSRRSKTNYRRLRNLADRDVRVTAEHPEADLKHIAKGIVRRGLKVVGPKRSEEHTSELQSHSDLVCRLLLEKKKKRTSQHQTWIEYTTSQSPMRQSRTDRTRSPDRARAIHHDSVHTREQSWPRPD